MKTKDGQKYAAYVQTKNKTKFLIKQYQSETYKVMAAQVRSNPKKFLSYINGKTKVKSGIPNLVMRILPDESKDTTTSTYEQERFYQTSFRVCASVFTLEPQNYVISSNL